MKPVAYLSVLAAGAAAGTVSQAEMQTNARPNVLFIVADDLKPTLRCYGDRLAITPNIDRLASNGVTFITAQCPWPVCGASRASLMTSLMPEETTVFAFTPMRAALPNVITLPQHFKNNGYETVAVGKVHDFRTVGDIVSPDESTINGIEKDDVLSWTLPFDFGGGKTGSTQITDREGRHWPLAAEAKDLPESKFADGVRGDLALNHLKTLGAQYKTTGKPFFVAVGFARPHLPFLAPTTYWNLYNRNDFTPAACQKEQTNDTGMAWDNVHELQNYYALNVDSEGYAVPFPWNGPGEPLPPPLSDENQKELLHGYYACVSFVDAQVGRLLNELEAQGIASNTVIVFLGDHGFHLGDHNKWGKHTPMEQAVRVPMIITAPRTGLHGTASGSPVSLLDIYPTLCELAGLQQPVHPVPEAVRTNYDGAAVLPLRGKSLVPVLKNPEAKVRTGAVSHYRSEPYGYSYRTDRYRYIEWVQSDNVVKKRELFDYQTDPDETINIAPGQQNELLMFNLAVQMRDPAETPGCHRLHHSPPMVLSTGLYYSAWAALHGLSGSAMNYLSDPDGDGINNLLELATGGNPTNRTDNPEICRLLPDFKNTGSGEADLVYRRQRYAEAKGLQYRLEQTEDLSSGVWTTNGFTELGTRFLDPDYEAVTARISAATNMQGFIRLRVIQQ